MQEDNFGNSCTLTSERLFDEDTLLSVYHALVQPHFDYCCEVWDVFGESQLKRLQRLHNRFARVIMNLNNDIDYTIALNYLGWENLGVQK